MMKGFDTPVSSWMISPVFTVHENDLLTTVASRFAELGVSALPVLDASGRLMGIISQVELLAAGRFRSAPGGVRELWLPEGRVTQFMQSSVPVIRRELSLTECARRMLRHGIHRLYVAEDGPLEGVISTREMSQAVADAHIEVGLRDIMVPLAGLVKAGDPLRSAHALSRANDGKALVVMGADAPVGIFSQAEAAMSQQADPNEAVELWMDTSIASLPARSAVYRAAEQVIAHKARYVLATEASQVTGSLSGLCFARVVAGLA
jgi:CBS domain-containing protein